jgi:hypothetical protein
MPPACMSMDLSIDTFIPVIGYGYMDMDTYHVRYVKKIEEMSHVGACSGRNQYSLLKISRQDPVNIKIFLQIK